MPSLIDRILHIRTYGIKIRYTTKGEARVSWKGERIYIDKISFTIGNIRAVVHGLYETVRERLTNDVLFVGGEETATALLKIDIYQLFDNAAEMIEDWSFLQDTRNV